MRSLYIDLDPLAIARIVRTSGLQGNWYWRSGVMGFVACMFFFARLQRDC